MTTKRVAQLHAGPVHYEDTGSGPPIVLLAGLLAGAELWREVVPLLAGDHHCIAPTLPLGAHPEAMRPDADLTPSGLARIVADLLEALDLDDVTLVANDTAGAIAQLVVTRHPERVGRLVLTPCDAFENFLPPMFRPLQLVARIPGGLRLTLRVLGTPRLNRLPMALGWLSKTPIDPAVVDGWVAASLGSEDVRRDLARVLRGIDNRYTLAAAEQLHTFERPVLVAWAEDDRIFPVGHATRLAALFPDARVVMIPDSYTFVPIDQPALLAAAITTFLAEVVVGGGAG